MSNLSWCDGHLDLAYLAVNGRDVRRKDVDAGIGCVTLAALRQANVRWIFGTIFTEMGFDHLRSDTGGDRAHRYVDHDDFDGAECAGLRQLQCYEQLERDGELRIVHGADDLDAPRPEPHVVILMEGADPIRSPDHVGEWAARGLHIVGLSWATGSRYAGGNHDGGPLTDLGRATIDALDAHGIIHDLSHLSDAAFDGLLARARGRVVASHSNCRALLSENQRHLRDDQIRAIAQRGGIIGLNLYTKFLVPGAESGRRATLADCIAHIEHVVEVAGSREVVALGSDMDGGFPPSGLPEHLDHPAKLPALAEALRDRGWNDAEIEGFAHGNWLRFLRGAMSHG